MADLKLFADDQPVEQLASEVNCILERNERILTPNSDHTLIACPGHLDWTSVVA